MDLGEEKRKHNLLADFTIYWPNPLRLMYRRHHDGNFYIELALDYNHL